MFNRVFERGSPPQPHPVHTTFPPASRARVPPRARARSERERTASLRGDNRHELKLRVHLPAPRDARAHFPYHT